MREVFAEGDTPAATRLSAAFTLQAAGPARLLVISEEDTVLLNGEVFVALARCLQQRPDRGAAVLELADRFPAPEIESALHTFAALGVTRTTPAAANPLAAAYWDSAGVASPIGAAIQVRCLLPSGDGWLRGALEANGLRVEHGASRSIAVTADYLDPALAAISDECSEWLLAKPMGHTLWLGPLFAAGRSVCWHCIAHWLRANRCLLADSRQPSRAMLPSTLLTAAGMLATIAAAWVARGEFPELENTIYTVDTRTLQWNRHHVRPAAGCSVCRPQPRNAGAHGLYELVSSISGVVSQLTSSAAPFASYFCARGQLAPPLPVDGARPLLRSITVTGRGATAAAAEHSCIGEAVERYSAIFQGNEPRRIARMAELGDTAISPAELFLFSDAQYRERAEWNRRLPDGYSIPHPFDPAAVVEWCEVTSLVDGSRKFVPSAYCYLWYQSALAPPIYWADSNGCAAGETLEAAALAALLELVERDALAIWWDNRLRRPAWDMAALGSPELVRCRDALRQTERELHLLDITTDVEVPVCVAVATRRDGSEPYFATAAALDPVLAAHKAAGELAQILFWNRPEPGSEYRQWVQRAHLSEEPYLMPEGCVDPPPSSPTLSVEEGLARCVHALRGAGLDPFLLDLTRAEIQVPAVRAVVPGLRHHWGRYAPGRLYDVPVRLGWRSRPVLESELNPTVCML